MKKPVGKIAFFWDESFLWGLIAYRTFRQLAINYDLLSATDIRTGALAGYDAIFVPGGWASDKIVALGEKGREEIQAFVSSGGSYLGFCGGAGLALNHESGLALIPVDRMPTSIRVPSFSGPVSLKHTNPTHPLWKNVADNTAFHAWWPGQFAIGEGVKGVDVLATYGEPREGSFVTDLPIDPHVNWEMWEERYGINLNPERIKGEPAVIEAGYGSGKVLLSYLHFETPGDAAGQRALLNAISYLTPGKIINRPAATSSPAPARARGKATTIARELEQAAAAFIDFGMKNFLWYQRNDWLLQWRRGVRGIEYSTLYAMIRKIAELTEKHGISINASQEKLALLKELVFSFFDDAKKLVMRERFAMSQGPLSPLASDDQEILVLRKKLFSTTKRCGGMYKQIVDLADEILLPLLRKEMEEEGRRVT
jgi:glutamine amidotransferase-like uncharacterized protein